MAGGIAERWKEIMGSNDWEGLLDPLDIDVRQNLLIYGDLVQVTGDAFNNEPASNNRGKCRYSKKDLFEKTGLVKGNQYKYQATHFFDATAKVLCFEEKNWMGYVAVATDEGKEKLGKRDIVIVWKGSVRILEWVEDILCVLADASDIFDSSSTSDHPKAHWGFLSLYRTARDQVLSAVSSLVEKYKNEEMSITVTGHSLGAALATLNAADIASHGLNKPTDLPNKSCPVTAIVFASPKVGDNNFKEAFTSLQDLHLLRTTNKDDPVPTFPTAKDYVEMGEELLIDASKSPYLKDAAKHAHELQVYLHEIARTQGQDDFELVVERGLALINKDIDGLRYNKGIAPVSWWIEKNKGMVQSDDGSWQLDDYEGEDGGEN